MNKNIFKEKYKKKYGLRLTGGDTIKFGRVRFVVKVISDSDYEAKPTLIMKEEEEEEEKNEPGNAQRDKTFEEFDKFNENENFQDGGLSQRNRIEDGASMNKLKKSLKILQTIPKQSYESSLFFEMMSKPVEDFMSERSSEADEKYKDDEVVVDLIEKQPTEDKVCRICLGNETEDENCEENPLFAPCVCAGTMKYVHLDCMKQWVHAKRHSKEGPRVKSYNWKNLECELCKNKIHEEFEFKGRKYYLLDYYRPAEGHYLILESFTNTPHKTIHVITISEDEANRKKEYLIKVGRGAEVDVRITDISVSREHSKIYFSKGEFYCIDNYSKFGTVALLRQPISLPQKGEHYFQLQVGKHLIEIESESHMNCCFCNITNRTNKKYKGPLYDDFKHLLPHHFSRKLECLDNLTKVLETLNVEEAEEDLNREITRLRLANESLISQRTMMNKPGLPDIEDTEKLYTQDLRVSDRNDEDKGDGIDQTSLYPKEMNTMNDISQRKIVPTYGDTSVSGGKDVHISMGQSTMVMTSSPSRNVINKVLMKNSSTKEKFAEQNHSVPSGNQFTLNENNSLVVGGEMRDKPMKVSKMLYEEYKHPNTIEEEKRENPMAQERNSSHPPFYKSDSDNSEEEKVQDVALRHNVFMKQNEDESQGDGNIQIENLKKVVIKPHLNSSNVNSRKMSAESSHNRSSAKVSNNWVSRRNSSSVNAPNSRNLHSSDRKREELLKESEEMLQEL